MLTVFLSSTSKDLEQSREAAFRAIAGMHGYHCVRMEDFGSIDEAPDDFCRAKIAKCDLIVCIVGPLYGSRSPAGSSFTEREFDAAILGKKPCFVFMTAEDYPIAANLLEADEERKRQLDFRIKVSKGRIVTRFSTSDQVSMKVVQAIRNWEAARAGNPLLASQIHSLSYRVAVMNQSAMVSDEEVTRAIAALQIQIRRDFATVWGIDAELTFIAKDAEATPGSWRLVVEDDSRFAGAVCYHTLTEEGLPEVRVAVREAMRYQWEWTMAASHDLLEMLANPRLNLTVFDSTDGQRGKLYVREICDPVASARLAYNINGTVVSNFVYPAWFESLRKPGSAQFDHRRHLNAPFEVAPGSSVRFREVMESSGWRNVFVPENAPKPVSRTKAKKRPAA
jgi:Domain of unknown function (DUF4062)